MKQHITSDQYQELSDDAKLKLIKWVTGWTKATDPITTVYQDMTIGRMIEYLHGQYPTGRFVINTNPAGMWHVEIHTLEPQYMSVYEELVDALWNIVRDELEKDAP
jgi:hypothetical protein